MAKKGSIGLSVNMLVVIILSLFIFGGGMALLFKLVGGAEEQKAKLDAQTQIQLERLLVDEGKKVALPRHTVTLYKGENYAFGLGILNIEESTYGSSFTVQVELSQAFDEQQQEITSTVKASTAQWLLYVSDYMIKENQHQSVPIGVSVPKDAAVGTYIFDARVYDGNSAQYDNTKKFTVVVK
ncbi:MAG: hypothetical protein ABIA37_01930 [Candidatus Woesearchaeota archaeon]